MCKQPPTPQSLRKFFFDDVFGLLTNRSSSLSSDAKSDPRKKTFSLAYFLETYRNPRVVFRLVDLVDEFPFLAVDPIPPEQMILIRSFGWVEEPIRFRVSLQHPEIQDLKYDYLTINNTSEHSDFTLVRFGFRDLLHEFPIEKVCYREENIETIIDKKEATHHRN